MRRRVAEIGKEVIEKATVVAAELSLPGLDQAAIKRFTGMIRDRAVRCASTITAAKLCRV